MPQRKLYHLFDLGQLLPTTSDVVIADVIKALLLILSQDRDQFEFSDTVDELMNITSVVKVLTAACLHELTKNLLVSTGWACVYLNFIDNQKHVFIGIVYGVK